MGTNNSNTMQTAYSLSLSTWKEGCICCPGNEVWYKFIANKSNADKYTITTRGGLDTMGYLYNSSGTLIANNDDNGGLNFSITEKLTYGSTYYVKVKAYGNNTGAFDIKVSYTTVTSTETGSSMSTAIPINKNVWVNNEIECPGDEVWYKFTPSTTTYYTIYTSGSLDTVGYLYNASGSQIDTDDDDGSGMNFKMVKQLTAGNTYYIKIKSFGNNTGYFGIRVTNEVFVESVTIDKTSFTMGVGTHAILSATVSPSYATNKTLRWESENPYVATVNAYTGELTALNGGVTRVCAYAQDGSGKIACCEVSVNVSVGCVELFPYERTMYVGQEERFNAYIYPSDATNKNVIWCSCDPDIATVDASSGRVTAISAGTTTIVATSEDGGYVGTCQLKVIIDKVTISAENGSNKVVFEKSGKVWYCVNEDLVFDNGQNHASIPNNNSNKNFHLLWDENNSLNCDTSDYKRYSDDEIKLLFAIDPYGVCDYVHRAANKIEDLEERVEYKDDKFRILFNRDPKYFGRNLNGEWGEVSGYIEINDVLSESETIFGGHRIWDDYAILQIIEELITIIDITLSMIPQFKGITDWLDAHKTIDNILKIFTFIFGTLSNGIVPSFIDSYSPDELDGTPVSWANILVTNYMNLIVFLADTKTKPNCYSRIFDYYLDNLPYEVNITFKNGEVCELKRIKDALRLQEEN